MRRLRLQAQEARTDFISLPVKIRTELQRTDPTIIGESRKVAGLQEKRKLMRLKPALARQKRKYGVCKAETRRSKEY